MINWSEYWHYRADSAIMCCNRCHAEVWYIYGGYICSGKIMCFNEEDE